ncbi:MAG: radical SAM protein [Candidatus Micrarchaeia archaeon]
MKTAIAFVEIGKYAVGKLASHSEIEPFAIEYIGAAVEKAGYDVELFQQRNQNIDQLVEEILRTNPQIVGVSCYTYKFPDALKLAKNIKSRNPDIITILGGYHATGMPTNIQYGNFDFFVIGEGEETIVELLENINRPEIVRGIAYLKNGEVKINPRRERLDFSKLPWPLRKKEFLEDTAIKGIVDKEKIAQISYSRGCPSECTFCCSPEMWQNAVKFRNAEDVVSEMKEISKNYGVNYFFFADLTFNASTKRLFELTELLKKEDFEWCCMPSLERDNLDEFMVQNMAEAGCRRMMLGVESINTEVLHFLGKRAIFERNLRFDEIYKVFRLCDKYGIVSRAFLMLGNPNEKPDDIKDYLEKLKILLPDEIRIAITTPLPGSKMYNELDKNILLYNNFPEDWARFSTNELVFRHKYFKKEELNEAVNWLFDSYYQSKEYGRHLMEKYKKHIALRPGIENFVRDWLREKQNINVYGFD